MMSDNDIKLKEIQNKINKLPKHDFGIYQHQADDNSAFTGRIIITETGHIFENVGLTISVNFPEQFPETGQYDINIIKSYYPKETAHEIQNRESELIELVSKIIGLNLARCFYNVIDKSTSEQKTST